jgi:hypothetical protein
MRLPACRDCKWFLMVDGDYRRGVGQCRLNSPEKIEAFSGTERWTYQPKFAETVHDAYCSKFDDARNDTIWADKLNETYRILGPEWIKGRT